MKNFLSFLLVEVSPPNERLKTWVKKNKKRFQDRYGVELGTSILYGKAWNLYNKWREEGKI